ncbi:MAG: cell division ATP-binding protein FtsE [Firmicutes bacterium]|nr:cell division ATP-binding protein FtsE [Bacillota bacterium]
MIELQNVSKVYPTGAVGLRKVSLTVKAGEFLFVVGPTGAGKSTLLKLITREEMPTSGWVKVGGRELHRLRSYEVPYLRRNIGVVFQDYRLLPDRNVYENVAFAMRVVEASPREIRKRVPEVLKMVSLGDKARHYPSQLSGGEQQRASMARALVNRPWLLLADEPTGNLDPETSWGIINLLCEINLAGTTVLVATHAKDIVDLLGKRVVALEGGRLVRDEERGAYAREA